MNRNLQCLYATCRRAPLSRTLNISRVERRYLRDCTPNFAISIQRSRARVQSVPNKLLADIRRTHTHTLACAGARSLAADDDGSLTMHSASLRARTVCACACVFNANFIESIIHEISRDASATKLCR